MLATQHRMRTKVQFSETTRSGVRSGRRNLVLYTVKKTQEPTLVGFIVSKAVGNAVVRNKTKRRLRELVARTVKEHPTGYFMVVRALPASAQASWEELQEDYLSAHRAVLAKIAQQTQKPPAVADSPETASTTPREEP